MCVKGTSADRSAPPGRGREGARAHAGAWGWPELGQLGEVGLKWFPLFLLNF
jgi:hypothetical protein